MHPNWGNGPEDSSYDVAVVKLASAASATTEWGSEALPMVPAAQQRRAGLWSRCANQPRMVLSALLLTMLALVTCGLGVRLAMRKLGLRFMDTLLYLGLAEVPPPAVSRRASERERAAASRGTGAPLRVAS